MQTFQFSMLILKKLSITAVRLRLSLNVCMYKKKGDEMKIVAKTLRLFSLWGKRLLDFK